MKKGLVFILFSFFFCYTLISCSDDDEGYSKRDNEENVVKFRVSSNTENVPIILSDFLGGTITIKNSWEGEFVTKGYGAHISAACEDETVLMTVEIYVNGKLKSRKEGNRYISLYANDIKK